MKLALTILCENPLRRTGLTTLFHEFLSRSVNLFPDLKWVVFAGPEQDLGVESERIQWVRRFAANDDLKRRLWADHLRVGPLARGLGAQALLTVGFVPLRHSLPTVMHVNSMQHLSRNNQVGSLRQVYRVWMTRRGLRRAALVITNSKFAAGQILAACPAVRDRLVVSYEATQPQFVPEGTPGEAGRLKDQFGLAPGYLLWVSNFYLYKQADLLISGYAALPEAVRARMPLVMVGGEWQGVLAAVRRQVAQRGVAADVHFLGWVADEWLPPLYRHARAFCLPSREETFGRCVTEALASGTPCVLNDIPVMREVAGDAALIINFADPARVTQTLQRLFDDAGLRARLRQAGLAQAARFSFDRLTRERVEAVRSLLEQRGAG
jgi:alpha-1,3-rhamnosyl/mannosyltransferase